MCVSLYVCMCMYLSLALSSAIAWLLFNTRCTHINTHHIYTHTLSHTHIDGKMLYKYIYIYTHTTHMYTHTKCIYMHIYAIPLLQYPAHHPRPPRHPTFFFKLNMQKLSNCLETKEPNLWEWLFWAFVLKRPTFGRVEIEALQAIQIYIHVYMYVCIYIYMYKYIYIRMYIQIYMYTYACIYNDICIHTYILTIDASPAMYIYAYMYTHASSYMYIHMCVCIYT